MGRKVLRKEIAEITGLSVWDINRRVKMGKIPVLFAGNKKAIFDVELVEEYLKKEALSNVKQEDEIVNYGVLRKVQG